MKNNLSTDDYVVFEQLIDGTLNQLSLPFNDDEQARDFISTMRNGKHYQMHDEIKLISMRIVKIA